MQTRKANLSDIPLLSQLNLQLIEDENHRNPMSLEELQDRMRGWLETQEYTAVLFQEKDRIVGYALYKVEPEWVYLRQFFIVREFRRQGYGREAIEILRREYWEKGRRVRLEVLVNNSSAIEFYRALGFEDYCLTLELEN